MAGNGYVHSWMDWKANDTWLNIENSQEADQKVHYQRCPKQLRDHQSLAGGVWPVSQWCSLESLALPQILVSLWPFSACTTHQCLSPPLCHSTDCGVFQGACHEASQHPVQCNSHTRWSWIQYGLYCQENGLVQFSNAIKHKWLYVLDITALMDGIHPTQYSLSRERTFSGGLNSNNSWICRWICWLPLP